MLILQNRLDTLVGGNATVIWLDNECLTALHAVIELPTHVGR